VSATNEDVLAEIRRLRSDVDDRMTAIESRLRGLERFFQQVLDELASFRGAYNRHRHGPPELRPLIQLHEVTLPCCRDSSRLQEGGS
jgi:hypothetical protein